jgi:D-alanyl-D-alanine carboxypeptidase (penicillin-binding protein 5/6)
MTRLSRLIIALALLFALLPALPASAEREPAVKRFKTLEPSPRLGVSGAVLLDWQTGELLWSQNGHRRLHPASTTKVLTALIAIERGKLDDRVVVSRRAARTPGSSMYIKEGEVYSLHDLLHGLLLRSGNDAAAAIAEHIGGSVERFADLMNARARELGAKDSHFVNPHGLTHDQHLSTAYDLAVITRAALQNPLFAAIVATPSKELTYEELDRRTILYNTNRLLSWLPGADGVKTGTTGAAGPCLIASATREEQKLIAVVLNASNRWQESARLLEWGFRNWQLARLGRSGEVVKMAPVAGGKRSHVPVALASDLAAVLPRPIDQSPAVSLRLERTLQAPIAKGQRVGVATLGAGEGSLQEVALVAADSVPRATWLDRLYSFLVFLLQSTDFLGLNLLVPI